MIHDQPAAAADRKYAVRSDRGQIVGRIALFYAPRNRSKPWVWSIDLAFSDGHDPVHGFAATREAAMQAFTRSWFREA